jgi:hypothetical protein
MPSDTVRELLKQVKSLELKLTEQSTDIVWIKRIIVGAAGLGFVEKLLGWLVK